MCSPFHFDKVGFKICPLVWSWLPTPPSLSLIPEFFRVLDRYPQVQLKVHPKSYSYHFYRLDGVFDTSNWGSKDEQNLWLPNQVAHDPDTWTDPHLLQLKREYDILVDEYGYSVQETFTVQDPPAPPSDILLSSYHLSTAFTVTTPCTHSGVTSVWGFSTGSVTVSTHPVRSWETGKFGNQTLKSLTITGCSNNRFFTHNKLFSLLVLKVLTHVLVLTIPTCPSYPTPRNDGYRARWKSYQYTSWKSLAYLNHIKCRTNDDRQVPSSTMTCGRSC